jgi:hypothetical protein
MTGVCHQLIGSDVTDEDDDSHDDADDPDPDDDLDADLHDAHHRHRHHNMSAHDHGPPPIAPAPMAPSRRVNDTTHGTSVSGSGGSQQPPHGVEWVCHVLLFPYCLCVH